MHALFYRGRHRANQFSLRVPDVTPRPWFVQPIRQVRFRVGDPIGRLEQIDIYGRHLDLGPIRVGGGVL